MKNLFYTVVTFLALGVLVSIHSGPITPQAVAQTVHGAAPAAASITGDLVIDFMGAQRGYVEPCG